MKATAFVKKGRDMTVGGAENAGKDAAGRWITGGVLVDLLVITSLPFLLLWSNNTWLFVKPIFIDRWIYSGFHLHLRALLERYPYTYYASRAPWDISGAIAHHIFAPEMALYVLHFSVLYLAAFSMYAAALTIFESRIGALAAAILLVTEPYLLTSLGYDYVDGAYTACIVLSIASLSCAAIGRHWRAAAFVWGVGILLTVSLYILWVLLIPVEIVMFILLNRIAGKRAGWQVACSCVAGIIASGLLIGALNRFAGGPFLYFLGQIYALNGVSDNRANWYIPLASWIWNAQWLLTPAIAFVASIVCVIAFRPLRSRLWIAGSINVAAVGIFIGLEANHFIVLQYEDKVNAVLPFGILALGGLIARVSEKLSASMRGPLYAFVILLPLLPWLLNGTIELLPEPRRFQGDLVELIWVAIGAALLIIGVLPFRSRFVTLSSVVTALAFLSIVNFGSADTGLISFTHDPYYKQGTLAVFDASKELSQYDPHALARFWFNARDPEAALERDVNSTYLAAYSKLNENFPSLTDVNGNLSTVAAGDRVVILTSSGDPIPKADVAVSRQDLYFQPVAYRTISRPGVRFSFVVADVEAKPGINDVIPIDPRGIAFTAGHQRVVSWPVEIETSARPWAYAATLDLPQYHGNGSVERSAVELQAKDIHGDVWIGALSKDGKFFVSRQSVPSGSESRSIVLSGVDLKRSAQIVIESGAGPNPGSITLQSAALLVPHSKL